MPLDWSTGPLAEGLRCYRAGDFFDAHEHWESAWLAATEPDKTFLQALIQIAAAFHHLHRTNHIGTASLLRRSLRRLERYPASYGGVEVAALRENLCAWLAALDRGEVAPKLPVPRIG